MNRQETKEYILRKIDSLLEELDGDYEPTDIVDDAVSVFYKVKDYLEEDNE